ncbi:hypothetical protein ACHMZP_33915 [Rhodococcus baikonurensis]|uniref:hypothetical protein n=1 Tax=Rhodococcus baikonurensis TaxID=172041 RepID=UPI0037881AA4
MRRLLVPSAWDDSVIDQSGLGRDWAPLLRWAIALDDCRLVFAAEGGLELA